MAFLFSFFLQRNICQKCLPIPPAAHPPSSDNLEGRPLTLFYSTLVSFFAMISLFPFKTTNFFNPNFSFFIAYFCFRFFHLSKFFLSFNEMQHRLLTTGFFFCSLCERSVFGGRCARIQQNLLDTEAYAFFSKNNSSFSVFYYFIPLQPQPNDQPTPSC